MISLYIIDDHPIIVAGLKKMFHLTADGIKITGNAQSVDDFLKKKDTVEADLIMLDLYLPGSRADENVKKLKSALPLKSIVIYTSEESDVWK
jgi:DNA-binding NarL/FixJ family response regulator